VSYANIAVPLTPILKEEANPDKRCLDNQEISSVCKLTAWANIDFKLISYIFTGENSNFVEIARFGKEQVAR
jgi:hypothetical protein